MLLCLVSAHRSKPWAAGRILTCTESGHTAISTAHRPAGKIIAVTPHDETIRRMQLCWGVEAISNREIVNLMKWLNKRLQVLLATGAMSLVTQLW